MSLYAESGSKAGGSSLKFLTLKYERCNTIGVSPSGKAAVFGTAMRRFESCHPKIRDKQRPW